MRVSRHECSAVLSLHPVDARASRTTDFRHSVSLLKPGFFPVCPFCFFSCFSVALPQVGGGMCVCAQKCQTASMMACSDGPVSFYFLAGRMRRGVMRERVAPVCFEDAGVYDERM